jgi:hypothetical protein
MLVNKIFNSIIVVATFAAVAPAAAFEAGSPGAEVLTGIGIGGTTAAAPGPGIYTFDQVSTYQAKLVGPGAPNVGGQPTVVNVNTAAVGILWAPGWIFFGATYDAVLVQPAAAADVGSPVNSMKSGIHNTIVIPSELSWKFGDSGFFFKTNLAIGVPDGSMYGPTGLGNVGNPWWTFRPGAVFSYLKDGWNFTGAAYAEFNTRNTLTNYRSGTVVEVDLRATKAIGKFTLGPIGYYVGQVSDDSSSAFYNYAINLNRYNTWAAGGLIGYDFGPAQLNVWAVKELSVTASGGSPFFGGPDRAAFTQGSIKAFASLSYRLWAPEAQEPPSKPLFHK